MGEGGAKRELASRIRELRLAASLSQKQLADRVGFERGYVCQAESARGVPSENLVYALDRALDAAGELRTLREQARREQQARRYGLPNPREVTDTDRREFVQSGALAAAAGMAADVSRLIASVDPDPLTMEEMEADVDRIAATYMTTPHQVLTPRVLDGWREAEKALAGRVSLAFP
ncbi:MULTISPECIES: helix-turn-helix transcriptional regulator [Protofrankia]|uniref:helix-turn-helix transcriptional regulator n=1 Tax=Protofrankia TaxID=2994361 RepID=UPI00069B15DC|nr:MULTISPECIES: helix-turn-helix transcriptional regulator [Protofrankia]ONH33951.1 hypothetical protein BL254_18785 [Protofrankia sp. BMG5.30]